MKTKSYMVDLKGHQFSDAKTGDWVHMLPVGDYTHPMYGDINLTSEKLANMAQNFETNVRGITPDIDYAHKLDQSKGDKAAGWVQKVELRDDGLWGFVEFTNEAASEIKDGAWRYFSAEYVDEWCNNQDPQQCWPDVLLGGALTNRPYMKDLTPINFSEFFDVKPKFDFDEDGTNVPQPSPKGEEVKQLNEFLQKLFAALGIDLAEEEPTEEEQDKVLAEVKQLSEKAQATPAPDPIAEKKRKFAEEFPDEAKALAESQLKLKDAHVDKKFSEWKHIPPALHEDLRPFMVSLSEADRDKFESIVESIQDKGLVPQGEAGTSRSLSEEPDEAQFLTKVSEFQKSSDMSFSEAVTEVARANPELANAYRKSAKNLA